MSYNSNLNNFNNTITSGNNSVSGIRDDGMKFYGCEVFDTHTGRTGRICGWFDNIEYDSKKGKYFLVDFGYSIPLEFFCPYSFKKGRLMTKDSALRAEIMADDVIISNLKRKNSKKP